MAVADVDRDTLRIERIGETQSESSKLLHRFSIKPVYKSSFASVFA
jgi:hypothetical protein